MSCSILRDLAAVSQCSCRQSFTVTNTGTSKKTFKISHIPAGTVLTVQPDSIFPADGPVPLSATAATVKVFPQSVTVIPGQTRSVSIHITPPTGSMPSSSLSSPAFSSS